MYEDLLHKLKANKKYKALYEPTIQHIIAHEAKAVGERSKDLEQRVRERLHQIWGAYWDVRPNLNKLPASLQTEEESDEQALEKILSLHTSTKERLPYMREFYARIFEVTGIPQTLIDHGCGFMPLSLLYLNDPICSQIAYIGYDIDEEEIECIRGIIASRKSHTGNIQVSVGDLVTDTYAHADVVFMLKLLPVLEQQLSENEVLTILQRQQYNYLVISYPTHSLGGKKKGMEHIYPDRFKAISEALGWKYSSFQIGDELVYIVHNV